MHGKVLRAVGAGKSASRAGAPPAHVSERGRARRMPGAFSPQGARWLESGMRRVDPSVRERLRHVYWIGGASGAGKSTIARRIAAERGLPVYATDDAMADHARRSTSNDSPLLHAFMTMDMDARWVTRTPETMLDTFPWFQGEGFDMIIDDIVRPAREPRVIVEGFRLLPRLVAPLLSDPARAVWLLPTPEFRRAAIESRGGSQWAFLARTSEPERALLNLLERDRLFTDVLREETTRLKLAAIDVDATTTEDDLVSRVGDMFGP